MPYSDKPPALVLPNCPAAKKYFNEYVLPSEAAPLTGFCNDWKDSGRKILATVDEGRPAELNACLNRRADGVRYNNWCFRCMAGYPFVKQHKYDAERPSDRPITVHGKPGQ